MRREFVENDREEIYGRGESKKKKVSWREQRHQENRKNSKPSPRDYNDCDDEYGEN